MNPSPSRGLLWGHDRVTHTAGQPPPALVDPIQTAGIVPAICCFSEKISRLEGRRSKRREQGAVSFYRTSEFHVASWREWATGMSPFRSRPRQAEGCSTTDEHRCLSGTSQSLPNLDATPGLLKPVIDECFARFAGFDRNSLSRAAGHAEAGRRECRPSDHGRNAWSFLGGSAFPLAGPALRGLFKAHQIGAWLSTIEDVLIAA
jgi:hypothetical protein